ncbi:MAG TPA: DNA glycosylase [bacterium]|nr:DNA glycosylase [bacterium]
MKASGRLAPPAPFSLGLTLLCGQCFRWEGPDAQGVFEGVAGGAFWRLRQDGELFWECSASEVRGGEPGVWLVRYLGLDEDLSGWVGEWENHSVMEKPLAALRGLRLMRQEPWECLVSYMFAQGLSVKVIRQALRKFCEAVGSPLEGVPGKYDFPGADRLAGLSPDVLRPFTNNYRARADRIIRAARSVRAGVISLDHLATLPCDQAREALMGLDGIGPKIADCVLLFSLDQPQAFPLDRWVLRAMRRHFRSVKLLGNTGEAPTPSQYPKIVAKARRGLGVRCGLVSEYLFLYLRLLEDAPLRRELAPHLSAPLPPLPAPGRPRRKPGTPSPGRENFSRIR